MTEIVLVVAIVLLLVYEGYTLANKKRNDTISDAVWRAAYRYPLVAFLAGLLCGHWFWAPARCVELLR